MRVPILKQGDYLIASIQSALNDDEFDQLLNSLVLKVENIRARGVIIDVTVLDIMDSYATRMLRDMAHMIKLKGVPIIIVGIQPEVALTMVQLGLSLGELKTALDLDEGLSLLDELTEHEQQE